MKRKNIIDKIKTQKAKIATFLMSAPVFLLADDSNVFASAGKSTQKSVASSIQSWMWLSPFIIIAPAIYGIYREHKIAQREEKGQDAEHMDSLRYGLKLFKGALLGGAFSFVVVTLIGKLFFGMDLGQTWNTFMFKPMKSLLGISS